MGTDIVGVLCMKNGVVLKTWHAAILCESLGNFKT